MNFSKKTSNGLWVKTRPIYFKLVGYFEYVLSYIVYILAWCVPENQFFLPHTGRFFLYREILLKRPFNCADGMLLNLALENAKRYLGPVKLGRY